MSKEFNPAFSETQALSSVPQPAVQDNIRYKLLPTIGHAHLADTFPHKFSLAEGKSVLPLKREEAGYKIVADDERDVVIIEYDELPSLYRGYGRLLTENNAAGEEKPIIERIGLHIDCSRGAVYRPEHLKDVSLLIALNGYNQATLYTEYFEVDGHPEIQGGQLSKDEIHDVVEYAQEEFGITFYPSMQTLAHLEHVLKHDTFRDMQKDFRTIDPEHSEAYTLIEDLMINAAEPYDTNRINIGCDESFMIDDRTFVSHVQKVKDISYEAGLSPIIWADMVEKLSPELRAEIPLSVTLNFWDYNSTDPQSCHERIVRLQEEGFTVIVSPGTQSWNRFYPSLPFAMHNIDSVMQSAKDTGVNDAVLTIWGDDRSESALRGSLPAIIFFAEHSWQQEPDWESFKKKVGAISKDPYGSFLLPSSLDYPFFLGMKDDFNISKILFYEDPIERPVSGKYPEVRFRMYYKNLAAQLMEIADSADPENKPLFIFTAHVADFLSIKADLGNEAAATRDSGDSAHRETIAAKITEAIEKGETVRTSHKTLWDLERKEEGFDALNKRYDKLMQRLAVLRDSLDPQQPQVEQAFRSRRTNFSDLMWYGDVA